MAEIFTVEMGESEYSIVAPDETPGEPVPYGEVATLHWSNHYYYSHVEDPDKYPEGGTPPPVYRVDQTTTMESKMLEVEDAQGGYEPEEEEEEEEGEEGEPRELEPGVIEFPEGDDPDEDLPRAEDVS